MESKRTFKLSAPRDWPLASKFSLAVVIVAILTAAAVLVATRIAEQSARDQAAGQMASLIGAGVAVVIFAVVAGNFAFLLGRRLARPLVDLTEATERLGSGQFDVPLPKYSSKDEIGRLTASFETMVIGLRDLFTTLEERVAKRVHELELAAEVGRRATAVVELDVLLAEAVGLIRERFDLYYTQIYLLDDARQFAVMREGTGTVGQQLKAKGHKIPLGAGLVGTAAEIGQPVVVPDTHQDPTHLPNPLLPDTRSESAVPLLIGEEVIGVLDMQSNQPGTFSKENVPVFIALAGQMAIAINNARLFDEVSTARQHAEKVTRQLTREGWEEYLHSLEEGSGPVGYSYGLAGTSALDDAPGSTSSAADGLAALIQVRGEQIGSLVPQDLDRELTDEEKEILQAVADRVALRIENLRLFEQTQAALSQTETLYAASERLSRAEDIDGVLDVLVESTALGRLDRVSVLFFERPLWPDRHLFDWQQPSAMTVAAAWERGGEEHMPVGTRYDYDEFPAARVLVAREGPAIIRDAGADERLTGEAPAELEQLGVRGAVSWTLEVGGQWIGFLNGQSGEALDLNEAEMRQISTLVDQAATVIQNLRLYEQTQDALSQAETLYVGSERLGRAAAIGDVLNALLRTTDLGRLDRANIQFFDRPVLPEERPEAMTVAAVWERGGKEPRAPVGTRYDFDQFPAAELLNPNEPTIAGDIATDERLDENTRALFAEQLGMHGVVYWPLTVGKQWIGVLSGQSIEALDLDEDAIRQIDALADQAATVIQNLRLYEQTQVALAELNLVLSSMTNYMFVIDAENCFAAVYANPETPDLPAPPAVFVGKPYRKIMPKNVSERIATALKAVRETGQPATTEYTLTLTDGEAHYEATFSPVTGTSNILAVATDITERKRAEDAVRESRAQLQSILDNTAALVYVKDAEGRHLLINRQFEEAYHITNEEIIGKTDYDIFPKEIADGFRENDLKVLAAEIPLQVEEVSLLDDGLHNYIAVKFPLRDANGVAYALCGISTDITERKRADLREHLAVEVGQQLTSVLDPDLLTRQVVDLVQTTFDYYHVHIYALDEEGKMLVVREGTGEAGRVMRERGHSIALDAEPSLVAHAARTGQPVVVDDVTLEPAHLPNPLLPDTRSEVAIPLVLGERVLGVLDVQDDQAERFGESEVRSLQALAGQLAVALSNAELYSEQFETAERLRELDRLKSEFLANMSHELRTPLNSIIGYAEVLLDGLGGPLTELAQEDVQAIHSSGHHLLALINDILDIAKIEASQLELDLSEIDLNEFLPELIDMTQVLVKDRPVDLQLEIGEDVSEVVADEVRLRQILWNLLSNAIKFTEKGHVTLRCRPDDSQIIFEIEDTGIGIAPEDHEKVFEQFRQVDGSATRRAGGSGLGLAITRHLVQLHGGRIWLDSQVGRGSTFYFNLPINHEEVG
jgi:PAS domain S-box-containing protein